VQVFVLIILAALREERVALVEEELSRPFAKGAEDASSGEPGASSALA
jgi:hypothetical protein